MKSKQIGLAGLTLLACAWMGLSGYLGFRFWQQRSAGGAGMTPVAMATDDRFPSVPETDPVSLERINLLGERLHTLQTPEPGDQREVNLEMLGYSAASISDTNSQIVMQGEQFNNLVVTMALLTAAGHFAVIDGKLYREGDELEAGGARVRTITPSKVLLAGRDMRQWLPVQNPQGEALRRQDFEKRQQAAAEVAALQEQREAEATRVAEAQEEQQDERMLRKAAIAGFLNKGASGSPVEALAGYDQLLKALGSGGQ
ncbi:MAG: general secretion pathway protein GspB [Magnetococcus sp. WYHC-3]